jgi:hypothetical protein
MLSLGTQKAIPRRKLQLGSQKTQKKQTILIKLPFAINVNSKQKIRMSLTNTWTQIAGNTANVSSVRIFLSENPSDINKHKC